MPIDGVLAFSSADAISMPERETASLRLQQQQPNCIFGGALFAAEAISVPVGRWLREVNIDQ